MLKKIKSEDLNHSLTLSILIPICGTMNTIVGLNGCDRSSVVDAVRWVIGEISEKTVTRTVHEQCYFSGTTALSRKLIEKRLLLSSILIIVMPE